MLLLDTGAGYPALDRAVARRLGFQLRDIGNPSMDLLAQPIPRLELGTAVTMDQVGPALALDLQGLRDAVDEPLVGLLGASLFEREALVIEDSLGLLILARGGEGAGTDPVRRSRSRLAATLDPRARAVRVRVVGDGKVLIPVRVAGAAAPIELVLDTGATKTVLFHNALTRLGHPERRWRQVHGLISPTLYGDTPFTLTRLPDLSLATTTGTVRMAGVDAGIVRGGLADELERAIGPEVGGLLGHSFLRRFRVVLDLRERVLWLSPRQVPRDLRPHEFSGPGLQLARRDGEPTVVGVVRGGPADRAGVRAGDRILRVDGREARALDMEALGRALEGAPGTRLRLGLQRGTRTWTRELVRARYL
jgi:predicted aspartyl protease